MAIDYSQILTNEGERVLRRLFRVADPVDEELREEAEADHQAAVIRGETIRAIAERVAWELHAQGQIRGSHKEVERELIRALAEHLYPGVSVDI